MTMQRISCIISGYTIQRDVIDETGDLSVLFNETGDPLVSFRAAAE
jgi:hypothetical protein